VKVRVATRLRAYATDVPVQSTLTRIDAPALAPVVDSYHTNGFIIQGCLVKGSVALLPRAKFNWKVFNVVGPGMQEIVVFVAG
jgi:hypothetical protein